MKTLVVRLSSLGDLVLSTSGLERLDSSHEVHWLVASEFSGILEGHPRIRSVIPFSRRTSGLFSWILLGLRLRRQGFDQVVDLHRTFRTLILRLVFLGVPWRAISKPRWRRWGLFLLKGFWPKAWAPGAWSKTFSRVLSGVEGGRPDFRFLTSKGTLNFGGFESSTAADSLGDKYFYSVMPDSAWIGKCWPVESYLELVETLNDGVPIILGTKRDRQAAMLVEQLELRGLGHLDGRGLSWPDVIAQLVRSKFLVGNDTGLIHLSESVRTPAIVIFGPTSPSLGFAPLDSRSRVVEAQLGCRPCSTDGRHCYWMGDAKYACLKNVSVEQVRGVCLEVLRDSTRCNPARLNGGAI